jgi:hypothetical protein
VTRICPYCDEPILSGDRVSADSSRYHWACGLRSVIGSVAHLEKRCSCYVERAEEGDDPALTRRQAAEVAAKLWMRLEWERQRT